MPAKKRTWVVVADAASARILTFEGARLEATPVIGATFENPQAHGHSRDLVSDRPGRTRESVGATRHAEEPRTDPHRQAKSIFAREIAAYLERAGHERKFDRIVLVAPPVTLGDLRAMLAKQVARHVAGEINKDLTKLPVPEIVAQVEAAIHL